jgi:hypothetical protein
MGKDSIDMSDMMPAGAFIVGESTETGKIITPGKAYGTEVELAKAMLKNMQKTGETSTAVITPVKMKKGRPPKKKDKSSDIEVPLVHNSSYESEDVVLITPLGKIRLNVQRVLDSDRAMMLIFKDEASCSFEPIVGDDVTLLWHNKEYKTMYPGVIFTWIDGEKRLMLFFKSDET